MCQQQAIPHTDMLSKFISRVKQLEELYLRGLQGCAKAHLGLTQESRVKSQSMTDIPRIQTSQSQEQLCHFNNKVKAKDNPKVA
eukprot:891180-Ditylum_brightwellii.AAC.1